MNIMIKKINIKNLQNGIVYPYSEQMTITPMYLLDNVININTR